MQDCEPSNREPQVGIFWWFERKLIYDSTPLTMAEPYGDALTHALGHIDYWSALQARGGVPVEVEYEQPPRGRVGYNHKQKEFFMFADKCIIQNAGVVKAIIAAFGLPRNTRPSPDPHYRCAVCLSLRCSRGQY